MKVLITAHTLDEHGVHAPGDVIELSDGEARAYADKQWGILLPKEKAAIETPESKSKPAKKETAAIAPANSADKPQ